VSADERFVTVLAAMPETAIDWGDLVFDAHCADDDATEDLIDDAHNLAIAPVWDEDTVNELLAVGW
jgi:hypothetical protein